MLPNPLIDEFRSAPYIPLSLCLPELSVFPDLPVDWHIYAVNIPFADCVWFFRLKMIKRFANGDRNGKYTSGMAAFPFFACISRGKTKDLGNELVFNLLTLETKPSKHHSPPFTSFSSLSSLCVAPTHSINDRLKICIVCIAEKLQKKPKREKRKRK